MEAQYIVAIIETESDYPGIVDTYGPFDAHEASYVAASIMKATNFERGKEVQVSLMQPFDLSKVVAEESRRRRLIRFEQEGS